MDHIESICDSIIHCTTSIICIAPLAQLAMQLARAIRRLVARTRWWRRRRMIQDHADGLAAESDANTQNDSCALLELPADVVYLIFQALEPQHRLVLALACRTLRGFHDSTPLLRNQRLTRDQHLDYLACVARSFPEQWVCEACLQLHQLDLWTLRGTTVV